LGQGKEKRKGARGREKDLGRRWPTRGEDRRPERERKWVGLAGLFSFPFLFSKLNLFKQIYLNSNKFEFKP
jgi:hypothetical protein